MTSPQRGPAPTVSRRALLSAAAVGLGGLALTGLGSVAGCGSRPAGSVEVPATVNSLLRDRPFYIAHRGGGGDWPEMTAYAYEQCRKLPGLSAVELSLCRSRDGVLVGSHDQDLQRLTGKPYVIASEDWTTLSTLQVTARQTTDPKQPPRPLSRFEEVIDLIIPDHVLFVEPKVSAAAAPLLRKLIALDRPERVVWKQPINSRLFREAKSYGFATWGYVLNEPAHLGQLARLAADLNVDMLGAPLSESDVVVKTVVTAARSNGKPVIAQTIKSAADRDRALELGCGGLMTSTITELWATRSAAPVPAQ